MVAKQLTNDEIIHLAKLAKLSLTDKEIELYKSQLSSIIGYIGKLNELDTSSVLPTNQVTGLENVLREDEIEEARIVPHDKAVSNKKEIKNGMFEVNAVFEDNE